MAGPGGKGWIDAAGGIQGLEAYRLDSTKIAASLGIAPTGAILVRPDGVIGWRCEESVKNPGLVLAEAVAELNSL